MPSLLQFGASFFDAAHSFNDVFIAGGITHAEALRTAETVATHASHVRLLQKIKGEIIGSANRCRTIRLTEIRRALGEKIERTFGIVHLKPKNFFRQTHNEILATEESLTHFLNRSLIAVESCHIEPAPEVY